VWWGGCKPPRRHPTSGPSGCSEWHDNHRAWLPSRRLPFPSGTRSPLQILVPSTTALPRVCLWTHPGGSATSKGSYPEARSFVRYRALTPSALSLAALAAHFRLGRHRTGAGQAAAPGTSYTVSARSRGPAAGAECRPSGRTGGSCLAEAAVAVAPVPGSPTTGQRPTPRPTVGPRGSDPVTSRPADRSPPSRSPFRTGGSLTIATVSRQPYLSNWPIGSVSEFCLIRFCNPPTR
jgi:hypothetical protein